MSTTTDNGKIFGNAFLSVYGPDEDYDPATDFHPYTISGELTLAVLGQEGEHMRTGMASNHDAETEVRRRLALDYPELLARLDFDSESGCFFAYADTEADALTLAGFITAIAHENERNAPPEQIYQRQERMIVKPITAHDADQAAGRQITLDEIDTLRNDHVLQGLRKEMLARVKILTVSLNVDQA